MRSQLYALVQRTAEPRCGEIGFDIAGTASGVWLPASNFDANTDEENDISLVPFARDPSYLIFSIGAKTSIPGLSGTTYRFRPSSSATLNGAFESVRAGTVACYDALDVINEGGFVQSRAPLRIYIQVTTAQSFETLTIAGASAGSCGSGPYTMPASKAIFARRT